jgi:hypothetical protein
MATLSVTFPAASPAPSLGYRVKYWPTSNPVDVTTATVNTNSFTATGLTGTSYSGTVEAICGGGTFGSARSFTAATVTVVSASAGFQPCIGGTIDDFLGGQITVSAPVSVDTTFSIDVEYVQSGSSCSPGTNLRTTIYGTILAGSTTATIDPCVGGGQYIPGGGTVCSSVGSI